MLGLGEGKRVIYYNTIENITCRDPEFRIEKFKYKLNFQA